MPKKGGKQLTERERARLAVIPDLYAIYSTYFSEAVIDMIAKQCEYNMDECIATLAAMVDNGGNTQTIPAPKIASSSSSISAAPAAASSSKVNASTLAAIKEASVQAAASVTADAKKSLPQGTRLLQPSATSAAANNKQHYQREQEQQAVSRNNKQPSQPASMWKPAAPAKPIQMPWISNSITIVPQHPRTAEPAADDRIDAESEITEEGYGSDANDKPVARAANERYRLTGYESQPYFEMQPSLLGDVPELIPLPSVPPSTVLDPAAASAVRARRAASSQQQQHREGIQSASPADPQHHLHSLYLQLRGGGEDKQPKHDKWKRTTFSAPPTPSLAYSSVSSSNNDNDALANLTPAQAAAHQSAQRAAQMQEKKERRAWEQKHEKEKREWKQSAHQQSEVPAAASPSATEDEQRMIAEAEAVSLADASSSSTFSYDLDSLPSDIPSLAPLSRAESLASYERVRSRPAELEEMLCGLFGEQVDRAVVSMIVESIIQAPPGANEIEEGRDVAQECCDTLLAIVAENERERARRFEREEASVSSKAAAPTKATGPKSKKPAASSLSVTSTPFVASAHQLTDSELAWRLSVDPDFDPEALPPMDANVGLKPQLASSSAAAPVIKNKKGHILLPRGSGTANVWAMRGAPSSVAAPDLGSQWKLAALQRAFPTVDRDSLEVVFQSHDFQFQETKAHLKAIYPDALVDESARPAPVEQPWSSTSRHHSKVTSTSRNDAERGVRTDSKWDAGEGYDGVGSPAAAMEAITDAELEEQLGPVLDGREVAGPSNVDPSSLRQQASVHASRRAAYFSAAVSAFTRGMGTVASELADKGKRSSRQLAHATARGGLEVFRSVNAGKDCRTAVDLHGLHVAEAVRIVPFILRRAAASSKSKSSELALITGMGHHSQGGIRSAKLAPAVLDVVKRLGYSYSSRGEGEIRVFLR